MPSHPRLLPGQLNGRWPLVAVAATFLVGLFPYFTLLRSDGLIQHATRLGLGVPLVQTAPEVLDVADVRPTPGAKGILSEATVAEHMRAIVDTGSTLPLTSSSHGDGLSKVDCHSPDLSRYKQLKPSLLFTPRSRTPYFFALNLRESLPLLPTLLSSVLAAINFLGPEYCALSIVEGNSPDGTADVLAAFEAHLRALKVRTHFVLSADDINPTAGNRFAQLAILRNMALRPIVDEPDRYRDATVLFINDVAACPDDLLELALQRATLAADMTCAMDWIYGAEYKAIFYDSFIARAINGDLFFDIPPGNPTYNKADDLFWNDPAAMARFAAGRPVQVFACWNGAVSFAARPIADREVAFRAAGAGECYNGEPELFCKDLWVHGHGRIAVVPNVNLAYSPEIGQRIKEDRGYTSELAAARPFPAEDHIGWQGPPEKVRCMDRDRTNQYWVPWNDTFGSN